MQKNNTWLLPEGIDEVLPEQAEKLEQLRVLALGQRIHVGVVPHAGQGVDTLEDYEKFVRTYRQKPSLGMAA